MGREKSLFREKFYYWFILCIASIMLAASGPAFAQDEEDEFMLEEITVTAEKREAELQKVPLDISVVRPDDMNKSGVFNTEDLDKVLPDLEINNNAGSFLQVNIRNVQNLIWNPTFETTVAMHLDGVQLTRVNGFNNMFYDLQRVEVLKGPQGTLYGRGSTAGSMNIVSQKPVLGEFGGNFEVEVGNYDLIRTSGALNIPVTEKLAFRIAGRTYYHDGYSDSGYNDADSWGGRISMTWEPTDTDTVISTFDFQGFEDNGFGITPGYYWGTYGDLVIQPNPNGTTEPQKLGPTTVISLPWQSRWATGNALDQNWNDNNSWGFMGQWEHELDFAYLTTIYGHRSLHEDKSFMWAPTSLGIPTSDLVIPGVGAIPWPNEYPGPYTYLYVNYSDPFLYVDSFTSAHFDSLETRLISKSNIIQGDELEWVVGAVAQDDVVADQSGPFYSYYVNMRTKSKAVFGQASWEVLKGWNLTGGYRYAWDDKEYEGQVGTNQPVGMSTAEYSWDDYTWKANLSWIPTDDIMTYIQYSKGYKTGNIDNSGREIPPEYMDSYEFGFKSRFFNSRLQVNASMYYYEYENYNQWATAYRCTSDANGDHYCDDVSGENNAPDGQINFYDYDYNENVGVSPGGSEQKGMSLGILWMLTPNDTVTFTGSWSKNEYNNYNIGEEVLAFYPDADNPYTEEGMQELSGEEFGGAPIRFNTGYTHNMWIGMDLLSLTATAYYEGKGIDQVLERGEAGEYTMPGRDEYWTMDASATYNSSKWVPEGMSWSARFWVNNLFDSQPLTSISYSDSDYSWGENYMPYSGTVSGSFIQPRTMGLSLAVSF